MKKVLEKLKITKELFLMLVGVISVIITIYKMYDDFTKQFNLLQKTTLRTMIWSEGIPLHDKVEACDNYIKLGYNSETKLYCDKLLEGEFKWKKLKRYQSM